MIFRTEVFAVFLVFPYILPARLYLLLVPRNRRSQKDQSDCGKQNSADPTKRENVQTILLARYEASGGALGFGYGLSQSTESCRRSCWQARAGAPKYPRR